MKYIIVLFTILTTNASAQVLKGSILKANGEPVPYASVYIHETTTGIVADEQGKFQVKLTPGSYLCEFRSLGYNSQSKTIEVKSENTNIQITLSEKEFILNELIVKPSKDNPANAVIRQAIAHAPQHLYQVSEFTSENYLKGSVKIEKIPGLMKMMIKDKKLLSLIGKLMVLESKNLVSFHSPNKYVQKVIAYKSSIPKEMEPKGGMRIATSSIYQSDFMGFVSPLSTKAFQYYHFKLEDIFSTNGFTVNKIKVIPKLQSDKLFAGYIYILDKNWSVFSADLSTLEMGTKTDYKISYQEIKPSVFLPITFDMNATINTMGVKGFGRFYSSIKYSDIKLNPSLNSFKKSLIHDKTIGKIEELTTKEALKTKEAVKLARLLAKQIKPKELKESEKSLEIKNEELVKLEIDSMSSKRDSVYWEEVRNVPLKLEEAQSFNRIDTLSTSKNIKTTGNSVEINLGKRSKASILSGGEMKLSNSANLQFDGILRGILKEYNFVDGAWFGQKASLYIKTSKTNKLNITPSIYYTSARHSVVWNLNNFYQYAPMSNGQIALSIGNLSEDIQTNNGTSRLFNSLSSLFLGDNTIRFYQKKYFKIENKIDISNGLQLQVGSSYEHRQLLSNNTNFRFFGGSPLPNYPNQSFSDAFQNHSATTAWIKLEYTPYMKYRIKNDKKENAGSTYPTFAFRFQKAISLPNKSEQSKYDRIDLSINQTIKLSEFDRINYHVSAGVLTNKFKLYAPDFNYFATNLLTITEKGFNNSFNLLPNYSYSESRWLETHFNYNSKYLLLKRIPFLQTKQFDETLHLNLLWSEQTIKPYSEIGYSIGVGYLAKLGVFSSFEGVKYKNTGIKISIPLLGENNKR